MWLRRRKSNESAEALKEAEDSLRQVQLRSVEVSRVAKALKDIRNRNHFAEALEAIIVGHGRR